MSKRQWRNLWSSYRFKLAETGSIAMALVWIDSFNQDDAKLLARIVF